MTETVKFSRSAARAMIRLSSDERVIVDRWIDQLAGALKEGKMPENNAGSPHNGPGDAIKVELVPYGGPYFGIDLNDQVHMACAFAKHSCTIVALNAIDQFDY